MSTSGAILNLAESTFHQAIIWIGKVNFCCNFMDTSEQLEVWIPKERRYKKIVDYYEL